MSDSLPPFPILEHQDLAPESNPTGEALLDRALDPFRVWVPLSRCIVLGHSQDPARELLVDTVSADRLPVLRRRGGGGAVLLSPTCVCVAFRFRRLKGRTLHDFFAAGTGYIRGMLREHYDLELVERGISDLAHEGPAGLRKVMGCSLYMPRDFALYLASLLVRPDYGEIARYLAHPSREPDYRAGRGHEDFLVGLDALVGRALAASEVADRLRSGLDEAMRSQLDWTDPTMPA